MLHKSLRLTSASDFANTYKKGKSLISTHLRIFYRLFDQNTSRFGFVVSKKHATRIVNRNRIKRWLRQAIQDNIADIRPGFEIIVQARPGITLVDRTKIISDLLILLKNAKILIK